MSPLLYKQLPEHTDRTIRRGIRLRFWKEIADAYVLGRMTFALGMAVFVVMFVGAQYRYFDLRQENYLYAQVLDHIASERERNQNAIVHVKMQVEEGRDKAAAVAKMRNLDPAVAESVMRRSEEVEFWSHSTNVMTVVRPEMPREPIRAFMNLERGDHVHVFRYEPQDCADQAETLASPGCMEAKALPQEQQTYRRIFDSVHDIEADYQAVLSVHTKPFEAMDLEPMRFEREEGETIVLSARVQENLKREYVYNKASLDLVGMHTFLLLEGVWYEMSVIRYEAKERLAPEAFEEVFDPSAYPLKQTDLIRVT